MEGISPATVEMTRVALRDVLVLAHQCLPVEQIRAEVENVMFVCAELRALEDKGA